MKDHIFHLLAPISFLMVIMVSCGQAEKKKPDIREFKFDDRGLKVIAYSVNERLGTMAILYGNGPAVKHSENEYGAHAEGEVYQLTTFEQQDHEFWYGSKINGALKYVETVRMTQTEEGIFPVYRVKYYGPATSKDGLQDNQARIKFILDQKAAVFP